VKSTKGPTTLAGRCSSQRIWGNSRSELALVLVVLGCLLAVCATAHAQPPATPYGESSNFGLNTNRIGFADSGLLSISAVPDGSDLPAAVSLGDPMPNPFNPRVTIPFFVGQRGSVELNIYDLQGRRVRTLASQAFAEGHYTRQWDGRNDRGSALPTGVYLVRIKNSDTVETRKISLVK
jgi:hypothetical protein